MTSYPQEYLEYLIYFHGDRDYFECHEVLEEFWKENPASQWSKAWLGLIQVAVAMYHQRRKNLNGAIKMLNSAIANLTESDLIDLGINAQAFKQILHSRLTQITERPQLDFVDINIPLNDEKLLKLCMDQCVRQKKSWEQPSDLLNEAIIHKHSLRDRSGVIQARLLEIERRQKLRKSEEK